MNEEQSSFEEQPVADHNLVRPKPPLWRRRNVQLLFALALLVVIGLGFVAFSGDQEPVADESDTPNTFSESPVQTMADQDHPKELLYAYWEDDTVRVRSRAWTSGERTDVFSYRADSFSDADIASRSRPAVGYDPSNQYFLYSDTLGIQHRVRSEAEPEVFALKEPTETADTNFDWFFGSEAIRASSVRAVNFSRDGSLAAIIFAQNDNSAAKVVEISSKNLVETGSTTGSDSGPSGESVTIQPNSENAVFRAMGILPGYFFSSSGAAIIGDGVFSPDASSAGLVLSRSSGGNELVIVASDGSFDSFGQGDYTGEVAMSSDGARLFALRRDGSDWLIEEWSTSGRNLINTFNVKSSFVVPGTIEDVDLFAFDTVYASVRSAKSPSNFAQFVIDVPKQDQLAEFAIDRRSAFSVLYAKQ